MVVGLVFFFVWNFKILLGANFYFLTVYKYVIFGAILGFPTVWMAC